MKELMNAVEELHTAQIDLIKRWQNTYTSLLQQNQLLNQQVDFLQERIIELERQRLKILLKEAKTNTVSL